MGNGVFKPDIPFIPVGFDPKAYDSLIKTNGLQLIHYKAVRCPIGIIDSTSIRSPHHEHSECSNGYIYKYAGLVTASLRENGAFAELTDAGILDGSRFQATFPRFYDDCPEKQIFIQVYDRFYLKDLSVVVPNTQLVEYHISGVDKLTYKAEQVEYLIDSHGTEYFQDQDFQVQNGKIVWTGKRPQFDAEIEKGDVYSVRYLYTPFLYAERLLHEVRVMRDFDKATNSSKMIRAQYGAVLAREYYQYKQNQEDDNENGDQTILGARDGMFGPK